MEERDSVPAWIWTLAGCLLVVAFLEARPETLAAEDLRARTPSGFTREGPLTLDSASARELRALPGIGQTRALAIVRSRFDEGPIARAEELERIPGIGPAIAARVREALVEDARVGASASVPP